MHCIYWSKLQSVCWKIFASYFKVELKEVKLKEGCYVMDPMKAVEMMDKNTICFAAILGSTLTGEFEDVKLLNELPTKKNKEPGVPETTQLLVDHHKVSTKHDEYQSLKTLNFSSFIPNAIGRGYIEDLQEGDYGLIDIITFQDFLGSSMSSYFINLTSKYRSSHLVTMGVEIKSMISNPCFC